MATKVSGYTGISFPFRVGNNGGVLLSTTNQYTAEHIIESVRQILGTEYSERVMEAEIYSDVDASVFEPNDELAQEMLAEQIVANLERLEERISVDTSGIDFYTIETDSGEEELYANITFTVEDYQTTYTASNVRIN